MKIRRYRHLLIHFIVKWTLSVRYIIIPNVKDSHDADVVITLTVLKNEDPAVGLI